jgi:radical SAM superfamily enzyme YgiQ (UPF0313 family)
MKVYLADLGHNQLTLSSDVYPLGVANLATYALAYANLPGESLELSLYREPLDLKAALDACSPDVLALSSYSWNHNLSLSFARYAKARNPRTLTVMGGPNYPLTLPEMDSWLRTMPEIDVASRGPTYEGERAFLNLLRRFHEVKKDALELRAAPLDGCDWIDPRTGAFVRGGEVPRIEDLDEIPSPYLSGWLDAYLKSGYLPMLQIARGCPFTCSFCNSAVTSNSRIFAHSVANVNADLLYLAERVNKEVAVTFADDNFGMYERDEEVADYIAFLQEKYGWPRYIRTTTGKNRGERIIKVMRKIRGALPMTAAVQSMNPVVLKNIKRSNIRLETYAQIQTEVRAQGMQSYGEMILGLPGETRQSFLKGIRDLMSTGVQRVSAHQLMLLHGAPLATPESRKLFGLETRFRLVARNLGNYTGEPVFETEEMVCQTSTMSFQDYLYLRVFHLLLTIFYYEDNLSEAFEYARQNGVEPFDLVMRMHAMLPAAPPAFRKVVDDFVQESQDELFTTREACIEWARKHFDGLVSGEIGGNLLSKYSMLGRFFATHASLDFLEAALSAALRETPTGLVQEELDDVMNYLRAILLHSPFMQSMAVTPSWISRHDVEAWARDKFSRPLAAYRFSDPAHFSARMPEERRALLSNRLATYGDHPSGLGKFTRTLFARDLRRTLYRMSPADASAPLSAAS